MEVLQDIDSFWDSPEMKRLFNPHEDETIMSYLIRRVEIIDSVRVGINIEGFVDKVTENPLTSK